MDTLDRYILTDIQIDFPLVSRPFRTIAERHGLSERELIERLHHLSEKGVIRRVGAIIEYAALGYVATLVGAKVARHRIDEIAAHVCRLPEVTHCYERDHRYAFWFTLITATRERLRYLLSHFRALNGVQDVLNLPSKRVFKRSAVFDLRDEGAPRVCGERYSCSGISVSTPRSVDEGGEIVRTSSRTPVFNLSSQDWRIIREIQGSLQYTSRPFLEIAERSSVSEDFLLGRLREWISKGLVRRFGATLSHQAIGIESNVMVVWDVPRYRLVNAGMIMAGSEAVSHCFQRRRDRRWPYNMYTMIHGRQKADCEAVVDDIRKRTNVDNLLKLFTVRQFKKDSIRFAGAVQIGRRMGHTEGVAL